MTATDELRAMLDERGVEWESEDVPSIDGKVVYRYTSWGEGYGVSFCEPIGATPGTLGATCDFSAIGVTPEQAVAASLGHSLNNPSMSETLSERGTCRCTTDDSAWCFACSNCGKSFPRSELHLAHNHGEINYCPNCGAKVEKVES